MLSIVPVLDFDQKISPNSDQVVWASTTGIGCGITYCPRLEINEDIWEAFIVVCDYGEG